MRMLFQSMIIAFSMYSKIPMPKVVWNEKNMKYAFCFFPFVGAVVGLVIYIAASLGLKLGMGKLLFAAIMTVIPILITGGIHVDGFLDTMDALSSYGDREKKLAILKDSNSGAFAIVGAVCYFVLTLGFWSEVKLEVLGVIAIGYALSRTLSGLSIVSFPLARNTGLAATFKNGAHRKCCQIVMLIYLVLEVIIMLYIQPMVAIISLLGVAGVFAYHYYICKTQFGGITGDLAGYFSQNCELMILGVSVIIGYFL